MSGIYIHIPFCRQACHYCNFHFSTSQQYIPDLVESICKEIKTKPIPSSIDTNIRTIYFGGGTPSILTIAQLEKIIDTLASEFNWSSDAEITIETNPEDINAKYLEKLHLLGFNRLSVGIQSFHEKDLESMNRNHDARTSHKALQLIQQSNFHNYSIDLMFGLIGSSIEEWKSNIDEAIQYNPTHISCYNLTIEEQTAYHHLLKKNEITPLDDGIQADQFKMATQLLGSHGYVHYEISNYAKPGYKAVHNTNYWNQIPYISYGPSGHSYDGHCRFWNISNNQSYIKALENGHAYISYDQLDESSSYNEIIMLGLRTAKGISKDKLSKQPLKIANYWNTKSSHLVAQGVLILEDGFYTLHKDWWYLSDDIAVKLFYTEPEL